MRRRVSLLAIVVASLLATASAQPKKEKPGGPGGGGAGAGGKKPPGPRPGAPPAEGKPPSRPGSGDSPAAGGNLAFDSATGKLKGTWAGATIPSYRTPMAAPLLGTVGYGTDSKLMYGPFEAGFGAGPTSTSASDARPPYPCKDGSTYSGYCPGGMDVKTCEETLFKTCASGTVRTELFMDECGGHAIPYHYHMDPVCLYKPDDPGHSGVVGVMLDGRPLYGRHETTGTAPADLDPCGGHTGTVPAYDSWGIPEGAKIYHYHARTEPPFLLGCYGDETTSSMQHCRRLYQSGTRKCGDGAGVTMSGSVELEYDLWCPCYDSDGKQADGDSNDDEGVVVAAPAPPRPPGLPDGYDTWEEYKEEQDRKAEHAKRDAEKKKEAEEKKKKKEAEEKKKEAEEKKKEAEEKKKEAEEKRKKLEEKKKEAEEKRKKLEEERKEAKAKRDAMLAKIADAKAARRAKILADAAIAGKNATRVKFKKPAPNATAACDLAFAAMPSVNSSKAFCNATETSASSGRRRRILNTEYDVTIEVNPEEVNVTAAVTELQSEGITPTTTQVDPLVALASVDGVDSGDLTALETEVTGAAEVQAQVAAIEDEVDSTESEVSDIESEAKDAEAEADELEAEADELEAEADELEAEAEYADRVADEEKKKADAAADTVSALPPRSDDEADVDIITTTRPKGGAAGLAGLFTALVATAAALVSVGQIG